jgi:flagellar basal-body rod modification protein FlgD
MSAISPTTTGTNGTSGTNGSSSSSSSSGVDNTMIASNFTTFLQLLTTQLKNQDPLSPMDTNQFTQQLVEFAQVEQQMKSNDQLGSLVSMEQSAQQTTALAYVGSTVVVDGSTAALNSSGATWAFNVTKPATATVTIRDSSGQTAYTGSFAVSPGDQKFTWDGKGNDGKTWPAGSYSMSVTAVDANKNTVAISTEVEGVVDSVDLTQNPPVLSVNGGNYTMDKIKRIVVPSFVDPGSGSGADSGSGSGSGSNSSSGSGSGSDTGSSS